MATGKTTYVLTSFELMFFSASGRQAKQRKKTIMKFFQNFENFREQGDFRNMEMGGREHGRKNGESSGKQDTGVGGGQGKPGKLSDEDVQTFSDFGNERSGQGRDKANICNRKKSNGREMKTFYFFTREGHFIEKRTNDATFVENHNKQSNIKTQRELEKIIKSFKQWLERG
jgi:hypothetical protein